MSDEMFNQGKCRYCGGGYIEQVIGDHEENCLMKAEPINEQNRAIDLLPDGEVVLTDHDDELFEVEMEIRRKQQAPLRNALHKQAEQVAAFPILIAALERIEKYGLDNPCSKIASEALDIVKDFL